MRAIPAFLVFLLAACGLGGGADVPGDADDRQPFAGIGAGEVLHFTGTEPFWGGTAGGGMLTYTTPESPDGATIPVERFAGRAGLSLSGALDGASLDMMVTEGECSDGMSDRTYPFTVTLKLGEELRSGCAWTDAHPFAGEENP